MDKKAPALFKITKGISGSGKKRPHQPFAAWLPFHPHPRLGEEGGDCEWVWSLEEKVEQDPILESRASPCHPTTSLLSSYLSHLPTPFHLYPAQGDITTNALPHSPTLLHSVLYSRSNSCSSPFLILPLPASPYPPTPCVGQSAPTHSPIGSQAFYIAGTKLCGRELA